MQYKVVGSANGPKQTIDIYTVDSKGIATIVGGIQIGSTINATPTQDCQRLELISVNDKPFGNGLYIDFNGVKKEAAA